jgi:hypothetical protein
MSRGGCFIFDGKRIRSSSSSIEPDFKIFWITGPRPERGDIAPFRVLSTFEIRLQTFFQLQVDALSSITPRSVLDFSLSECLTSNALCHATGINMSDEPLFDLLNDLNQGHYRQVLDYAEDLFPQYDQPDFAHRGNHVLGSFHVARHPQGSLNPMIVGVKGLTVTEFLQATRPVPFPGNSNYANQLTDDTYFEGTPWSLGGLLNSLLSNYSR